MKKKKPYIEYSSNNSGGSWWLTDQDWLDLEKAGWILKRRGDRFLGAMCTSAKRYGMSMEKAIIEFERITGQCATDEGCSCCGQPHNFSEEEDHGQ